MTGQEVGPMRQKPYREMKEERDEALGSLDEIEGELGRVHMIMEMWRRRYDLLELTVKNNLLETKGKLKGHLNSCGGACDPDCQAIRTALKWPPTGKAG